MFAHIFFHRPHDPCQQELLNLGRRLVCSHYFEEWLKRQQVRHSKLQEISLGYLKNVGEVVRNHLQPFFGQMSIKDISSGTIKQLKDNLLAKLQPKTVKNIMGTLHAVLSDAQERGDIGQVPVFPRLRPRSRLSGGLKRMNSCRFSLRSSTRSTGPSISS